eukprot:404071-Hanusia_phi.AAC.1
MPSCSWGQRQRQLRRWRNLTRKNEEENEGRQEGGEEGREREKRGEEGGEGGEGGEGEEGRTRAAWLTSSSSPEGLQRRIFILVHVLEDHFRRGLPVDFVRGGLGGERGLALGLARCEDRGGGERVLLDVLLLQRGEVGDLVPVLAKVT